MMKPTLFIFLDESGNFDFSPSGTKYYTFTALSVVRPFGAVHELIDLKHDFWESNLNLEYFHASEDRQVVRNSVIEIINTKLRNARIDCHIVEKRKTNPILQHDHGLFYIKIFEIMLRFVLKQHGNHFSKVQVIADQVRLNKPKKDIEKASKLAMAHWSKTNGVPYEILFHSSKSEMNLQITDYINWAVFRKWERGDLRTYNLISDFVRSEFETFGSGGTNYY